MAGAGAPPPPYAYQWQRGWGLGPLFPLMFIFFWFFLVRSLGWGPPRWAYRGRAFDREDFDEWHRRAHDQMKS